MGADYFLDQWYVVYANRIDHPARLGLITLPQSNFLDERLDMLCPNQSMARADWSTLTTQEQAWTPDLIGYVTDHAADWSSFSDQ